MNKLCAYSVLLSVGSDGCIFVQYHVDYAVHTHEMCGTHTVGAFYMKTQMPFELKIGKFSKKCLLIEFSRSQQISKIKAIRRILIELDVKKETVNRAMCSLIL